MTISVEQIHDFCESNFKKEDLGKHMSDSRGNYDDVFDDGKDKGYARALADILQLITGDQIKNPERQDCW